MALVDVKDSSLQADWSEGRQPHGAVLYIYPVNRNNFVVITEPVYITNTIICRKVRFSMSTSVLIICYYGHFLSVSVGVLSLKSRSDSVGPAVQHSRIS